MKSNFEFLNKYWPVLAQLGANVENYLFSDPNACIYKFGIMDEKRLNAFERMLVDILDRLSSRENGSS